MGADTFAISVVVWLANYTLQSTVIFGAVWLATRALPERLDLVSDSLWKCALVTSVVSPLLPTPLSIMPPSPALPLVSSLAASRDVGTSSAHASPAMIVVAIWVAVALTGLIRVGLAYRRVLRTIGDRRPLSPQEIESQFGRERPSVNVTASAALQIPIAIGHEICLPAWALEQLEPEQIRTITAHEAAHIARRDAAWRWTAVIASRVFFFQPLNHLAARKLRQLAECLCDEAAVAQTGAPTALASTLSAVARVVSRGDQRRVALLPSFASRESLTVRRVRRMLSLRASTDHTNALVRARGFVSTAASAVLLSLAAVTPSFSSTGGPSIPYVISAEDPAGRFTLTINRGKLVGASISGRALPSTQVRQRGRSLELLDPRTGTFSVRLTPQGGITWTPRRPPATPNHN